MGDYAKLGSACHASMRVLTDNRKFLDVNAGVYDILYTRSMRYPAQSRDLSTIGDIEFPEDIKLKKNIKQNDEEYQQKSCCGNK